MKIKKKKTLLKTAAQLLTVTSIVGIGTVSNLLFTDPISVQALYKSSDFSSDDIKKLCVGRTNTFFIKNDGSVWGFGRNGQGQLGIGTTLAQPTPVRIPIDNVKEIISSATHTIFVKNDGSIWVCGNNDYGQLGTGNNLDQHSPVQLLGPNNNVNKIIGGDSTTILLMNNGSILGCGNICYSDGTTIKNTLSPIPLSNVTDVSSANRSTLFLKNDGSVLVCGLNFNGELGLGNTHSSFTIPFQLNVNDVSSIDTSGSHSILLRDDGSVLVCGSNQLGQLGLRSTSEIPYGQLGFPSDDDRLFFTPLPINNVKKVICGVRSTIFIKNDGSVWACGYNGKGELGIGSNESIISPPVQIPISDVKDVLCSNLATFFIKNDGSIWGCGSNSSYELGINNLTTYQTTPIELTNYWIPPANIALTKNTDSLTAQLKKSNNNNFNINAPVTYSWYRNGQLITNKIISDGTPCTYSLTNDDKGKSITVKSNQYGLTSNLIDIPADQIVPPVVESIPTSVKLSKNSDILTAQLKKSDNTDFTTSAAVTYSWRRNGQLINNVEITDGSPSTYAINNDDKGQSITVIITPYNLISNEINIPSDSVTPPPGTDPIPPTPGTNPTPQSTTPASVRIKGTERVGNTLEAELLSENGSRFTTSAGVTYSWYRLSDETSDSDDIIGSDETYKLVNNDKNKYIKVKVTYNNTETFEAITSIIRRKTSSSHSSSTSSSSNSTADNSLVSSSNSSVAGINNNPSTAGVLLSDGWQKQSDNTWKYGISGQSVTGWKQINDTWYLFDAAGAMQTGWTQYKDENYYLKNDGSMAVGWELINGTWYLFNDGGAVVKGWTNIDGTWYYLNPNGAMATGWINLEGKWYYLYGDGSMAKNTSINGYIIDESGAWIN